MNGCLSPVRMLAVFGPLALLLAGCYAVPQREVAASAPRSTAAISHVVVLWSEAVLRQDQVPVAQGFAGKVYLFGPNSAEPATAPGKFTVYAYDDTHGQNGGPAATNSKPTRTWDLPESDLRNLLKKDAIGWSYSLWLPYGPPSATERRVTLRVCFTTEDGQQTLSESALVTLPAVASVSSVSDRMQSRVMPEAGSVGGTPESVKKAAVALAYCTLDERP